MKKIRITWVQIMAFLALLGILLSAVGTAWVTMTPTSEPISGEVHINN